MNTVIGGYGNPTKLTKYVWRMTNASSSQEAVEIIEGVSFENESNSPDGILSEMGLLASFIMDLPFWNDQKIIHAFWKKMKLAPRGHWYVQEWRPVCAWLSSHGHFVEVIHLLQGKEWDRVRFGPLPKYYNHEKCEIAFLTPEKSLQFIELIDDLLKE